MYGIEDCSRVKWFDRQRLAVKRMTVRTSALVPPKQLSVSLSLFLFNVCIFGSCIGRAASLLQRLQPNSGKPTPERPCTGLIRDEKKSHNERFCSVYTRL